MLLLCGHPNLLILSSSSLSENYHFSVFELFPYDLRIHVARYRKGGGGGGGGGGRWRAGLQKKFFSALRATSPRSATVKTLE